MNEKQIQEVMALVDALAAHATEGRILLKTLTRAAIESALREQVREVPEGWSKLLKAANEVLEWTNIDERPPRRDEFETGRMAPVRVRALADLHDAVQALSAAPPQPAQAEQPKAAQQGPVAEFVGTFHDAAGKMFYYVEPLGKLTRGALLYTAAAPQREPMTDEQWKQRLGDRQLFTILEAIRFVEREYGITKKEQA